MIQSTIGQQGNLLMQNFWGGGVKSTFLVSKDILKVWHLMYYMYSKAVLLTVSQYCNMSTLQSGALFLNTVVLNYSPS